MTNKEALKTINRLLDDYNSKMNEVSDEVEVIFDYEAGVALYKVQHILQKLCHMEDDLAEEYVDLLDVDYPSRDDYWDGYNKGYHDCEVELQAKEKQDGE